MGAFTVVICGFPVWILLTDLRIFRRVKRKHKTHRTQQNYSSSRFIAHDTKASTHEHRTCLLWIDTPKFTGNRPMVCQSRLNPARTCASPLEQNQLIDVLTRGSSFVARYFILDLSRTDFPYVSVEFIELWIRWLVKRTPSMHRTQKLYLTRQKSHASKYCLLAYILWTDYLCGVFLFPVRVVYCTYGIRQIFRPFERWDEHHSTRAPAPVYYVCCFITRHLITHQHHLVSCCCVWITVVVYYGLIFRFTRRTIVNVGLILYTYISTGDLRMVVEAARRVLAWTHAGPITEAR